MPVIAPRGGPAVICHFVFDSCDSVPVEGLHPAQVPFLRGTHHRAVDDWVERWSGGVPVHIDADLEPVGD